jgi:hypothetical protein
VRIDIFEDVTGNRDRFDARDWWDLFSDTGIPGREDYQATNRAWEGFLRAWYLVTAEPGHMTRPDWYEEWDMVPDLIDWQAWRELVDTP